MNRKLLCFFTSVLFCLSLTLKAQVVDSIIYEASKNGNWIRTQKVLPVYNAGGLILSSHTLLWDTLTATYKSNNMLSWTYNPDSTEAERVYVTWDGSAWQNKQRFTSVYSLHNGIKPTQNGFPSPDVRTQYTWKNNSWQNYFRTTYSYDSNAYCIQTVSGIWDTLTSTWINQQQQLITNLPGGQPVETINSFWETAGAQWKNNYRFVYGYNTAGKHDTLTGYIWKNNSWEEHYKNFNTTNVYPPYLTTQDRDSTGWVNSFRITQEHDSIGHRFLTLSDKWDKVNNVWTDWSRTTAYYQVTNTSLPAFTGRAVFNAYPNPCSEYVIVSPPDHKSMARIKLFNNAGQLVKQFTGNGSSIELIIQDLPPGIYLLSVEQNNSLAFSKILKY
jgi:hypothetical protein